MAGAGEYRVPFMITALAGGVGAARFLSGLVHAVEPATITAIVNTGDDDVFYGLRVCPDIDSVIYTLAGASDTIQGWGLADESFRTIAELERFGEPAWFRLGDLDLATHIHRTNRLRQGATLDVVTRELARSWGLTLNVLPMTNDAVATRITSTDGADYAMQEWFVRERCNPPVASVRFDGAQAARPAPGAIAAIDSADCVVVCPSNPVISIGPILAVPGILEALLARRADTVAICPIVGGAPVKGPADRLMLPLGIEVSPVGIAKQYAPWCATLVLDEIDAHYVEAVEAEGVRAVVADTMMHNSEIAAKLATIALQAIGR